MPLYILGLIVLIGILIMQIVKLSQSRKYSNQNYVRKKQESEENNEQNKTLYFPTDRINSRKEERDDN